jgi:hypothetical protein
MTTTTAAQRAEIRALARERIELRYKRDLLRLEYADLYEEYLWQRDKPQQMADLAMQIEEIDEQLREVETPRIQERYGIHRAQMVNICSGRLALRMREV